MVAVCADVGYNGLVQSSKTRIKRKPEINQLFGKIFSKCIKLLYLDKLSFSTTGSQKADWCLDRDGSSESIRQLRCVKLFSTKGNNTDELTFLLHSCVFADGTLTVLEKLWFVPISHRHSWDSSSLIPWTTIKDRNFCSAVTVSVWIHHCTFIHIKAVESPVCARVKNHFRHAWVFIRNAYHT